MVGRLKLRSNDRVAVIGAGPAGSLAAYLLLGLARQADLSLDVALYDPRDFAQAGPAGCNGCVGVINSSLWRKLQSIGIDLGDFEGIIQSQLRGYLWCTSAGSLQVDLPNPQQPIRTVFRGSGPRFGDLRENASFDGYLLDRAIAAGARHERVWVRSVEKAAGVGPARLVRLQLEENDRQWQAEAELVIGAFGLNAALMSQFQRLGIGYRPPQCVRAAQVELQRSPGSVGQTDEHIRVYNIAGKRVRQLVLTPKDHYATLTLLAPQDLRFEDLREIRGTPQMQDILDSGWDWPERFCHCLPRLQKRSARNFYADRIVLIGDAACCRYFKNGLESALVSAQLAAETAIHQGISRQCFRHGYLRRVRQQIIRDNHFGRFLLGAHYFISSHPLLMQVALHTRSQAASSEVTRRYDEILWNILSGDRSYRDIFYQILRPRLVLDTCMGFGRVLVKEVRRFAAAICRGALGIGKTPEQRQDVGLSSSKSAPAKLGSGFRVSIIGGGPAGTACAITLLQAGSRINLDLDVTIHEAKDFASAAATWHPSDQPCYDKDINQCIGVLSPPIRDILANKLSLPFPDHLVQKQISGYVLHGRRGSLALDEMHGPSYAVRRIMFDDYMMGQARDHGAQLNLAGVTHIRPRGRGFTIDTDAGAVEADLVVGAFGVDQGAADIFGHCFGYARPEYMQTIITKRHPAGDFLARFGSRIHAFLPKLRSVEFGAITCKSNHLSINIAGRRVDDQIMNEFLALPEVAQLLPEQYDEKGSEIFYPGCFPTSPAGAIFADRMVIIGDASGMIRPFKGKGVNSAMLGGIAAAKVIVQHGFSAHHFQHHYVPAFCHISEDILYARTARFLTNFLANHAGVDLLLDLAEDSPTMRRALAGAISGADPYKTIVLDILHDPYLRRRWPLVLRSYLQSTTA